MESTARTFASLLFRFARALSEKSVETPPLAFDAFVKTSRAYLPIGTSGAASTSRTPRFARSANVATGEPLFGTTIVGTLVTKMTGSAALPLSVTFFIWAESALAKTSAGAPSLIWVESAELAAKLKVTFAFGFFSWNFVPASWKASVSDEAAKTVMSPSIGFGVAVGAVVATLAGETAAVGVSSSESSSPPHAASAHDAPSAINAISATVNQLRLPVASLISPLLFDVIGVGLEPAERSLGR